MCISFFFFFVYKEKKEDTNLYKKKVFYLHTTKPPEKKKKHCLIFSYENKRKHVCEFQDLITSILNPQEFDQYLNSSRT